MHKAGEHCKCICTNRVDLIPASFKIRTILLLQLFNDTATSRHLTSQLVATDNKDVNDSKQAHVPLFHESIDHLNLAQSSNTSHQHTNIQMRWLPLNDGTVPSWQHPLAKHRLVREHGQWDLLKRSWHGLWTLQNWTMTAEPSVIPTWQQE